MYKINKTMNCACVVKLKKQTNKQNTPDMLTRMCLNRLQLEYLLINICYSAHLYNVAPSWSNLFTDNIPMLQHIIQVRPIAIELNSRIVEYHSIVYIQTHLLHLSAKTS